MLLLSICQSLVIFHTRFFTKKRNTIKNIRTAGLNPQRFVNHSHRIHAWYNLRIHVTITKNQPDLEEHNRTYN